MENEKRLALLEEMTSLERAVKHLNKRIKEIAEALRLPDTDPAYFSAPKTLKPLPEGYATVLGRDSLGRIKRKRNFSPEVREKKRQAIARAREMKLARIRESQYPKNEKVQ